MNTDYKDLNLKLEKVSKKNKVVKLLCLHMQFLRGYRSLENLKTTGRKTVKEPYHLCRISIISQKQNLSYRSHTFRRLLFYETLSIFRRSDFVIRLESAARMVIRLRL